jgi:phage FluMu protein Com
VDDTSERIEFRCCSCDRLLFKVSDVLGIEVEAKCPRCGETTEARLEADQH